MTPKKLSKLSKYPWGIDKYTRKDIANLCKYLRKSLPDAHRIDDIESLAEGIEEGSYNHVDKLELLHMVLQIFNWDASCEICPENWSWRAEVWSALTVPFKQIPLIINNNCCEGTKTLIKWRLTNGK